ncbi:MAG: transposase [Betaproteobacteria bacterium]|nr:transposase [Betaproteobacteria bacterium]
MRPPIRGFSVHSFRNAFCSPEGAQRIPGSYSSMVPYRRSRVAGGTFFFTVNLHNRRRTLLVEHADALRKVVRDVQTESRFVIDAMLVLRDHCHAVWTLPVDDAAYARGFQRIKARFTRHLVCAGVNLAKGARGELGVRFAARHVW